MNRDALDSRSKRVGFLTALSATVGLIVASSVLVTATQGFGLAGPSFLGAVVIAYIIMLCQASCFVELVALMPTAGSVYDYVATGLGRVAATLCALSAYMLVAVFAGAAEVLAVGALASLSYGGFSEFASRYPWILGTALILVLATVNVRGIQAFASVQILSTLLLWVTLLIFGLLGLLSGSVASTPAPTTPFFSPETLSLLGLALFLMVGVEYVTPLAAELHQPERVLPRAMFIGLTAVAFATSLFGAGVANSIANIELAPGVRLLDTPEALPHFAEEVLGQLGRWWLGAAVFLASVSSLNTAVAGTARVLCHMSLQGDLPRFLSLRHPRFGTPVAGIWITAATPAVVAICIQADMKALLSLVLSSVCAWLLTYLMVNASVVILRYRFPKERRPYRMPLFPLPPLLASAGMLVAIWNIAPSGLSRSRIYLQLLPLLVFLAALAWYQVVHVNRCPPFARRSPPF